PAEHVFVELHGFGSRTGKEEIGVDLHGYLLSGLWSRNRARLSRPQAEPPWHREPPFRLLRERDTGSARRSYGAAAGTATTYQVMAGPFRKYTVCLHSSRHGDGKSDDGDTGSCPLGATRYLQILWWYTRPASPAWLALGQGSAR